MKNKRLRQLIMMSKLLFYGMMLQCFLLGFLYAAKTDAQKIKTVKEVYVTLEMESANIGEVFHAIESLTEFKFSYYEGELDPEKVVDLENRQQTVKDVLLVISKEAGVAFRQVNNNISVRKIRSKKFDAERRVEVIIDGISVSGNVTDAEDGGGLPGVNVVVKGTTMGTVTDVEGSYQIDVPDESSILVFSSVGYVTREVLVGSQTSINISMESDVTALEEIVVVGYGTQKKENLTGAVSSIDMNDIETIPAANTATLLQGRLPGVTVSNFDPQPGKDNPQIRIRGIGTFNSGQEPLVIVDGVQSQLNQIPVSDIESVSVLKDASSAAIYGVRAANGVILVTTKRGKAGAVNVNLKGNWAFQSLLFDPKLLESPESSEMKNLWEVAEGGTAPYTDAMIQAMRNGSDPDHFANTDWYDEAFRTAPMQTYYMSVNGGNEKARYLVSGEFFDQEGILIGTAAKRYSLRSNVDIDVNERFKVGLNVYGFKRHYDETAVFPTTGTGDNSLIYSLRRFTQPTVPTFYSSGEYGRVDGVFPDFGAMTRNVLWAAETGENFTDQYRVESRIFAELELVKGLKWNPSFATIYNSSNSSLFVPTYQFFDAEGNVINENVQNSLRKQNTVFRRNLVENLLTYQLNVNNHNINLLAGHTAQYERNDFNQASIEDFPNNEIHQLDGGVLNPQVSGNAYEVALQSFFGRVNYNFMERYLFEVNIRHDGSSRMPEQNRWGTFPSFSAGWVMTQENFLNGVEFLSFLKVRASWGQLGNQEIGNYAFVQNINTGQDYLIGGDIAGGVAVTALANPNLTWETTTITDIGVDLNFLGDRLQVVADYFDKVSSDILIRLPQPRTLGVGTFPFQNVAEVQNVGWELDVKWQDNIKNKLTYFVGFNLSRVRNEIRDIAGRENWISGDAINLVGYPIGSYYGYIADGFFQSDDEISEHAAQWGTLAQGDVKYMDISGPEGDPDGVVNAAYDREVIGNPFPEFSYSFNLGGSFMGFDLYAFFQGVSNIDRWNWYNTENNGTFTESILDYWTPDNRDATYWRLGNAQNNTQRSTYYITDASYLRLKNLEFGYTLPQNISEKVKLQRARIFFSGYNLLTWTEVTEFDPEKLENDDRNRFYPSSKVYSVGLHLTF